MKKKTVYIWMSSIVVFSVALYAAIYFFNLQHLIKPAVASVDITKSATDPKFNFAIRGSIEIPLQKPMDVTKINELIYVADTSNKRVQVFDKYGKQAFQFGAEGSEEGQFQFPYGISSDQAGNVYVADLHNGNISVFDSKGVFTKYFENEEELESPAGLRIYEDTVYVTDVKKSKVFLFNLQGEKLLEIGGPGIDDGQLVAPNAVTVDKNGQIYVSDSGNNRVQIFDQDGKLIKIINGSPDGKGDPTFLNPRGIAVDSQGNLFVVNSMLHKLFIFDQDGKEIAEYGEMGSEDENFYYPNGLYIDEKDRLYITDTINQRISVLN